MGFLFFNFRCGKELLYSLPSGRNLLWVPKETVPTSHIYGLFLPKVSAIYVLKVREREQRMPLRRGEEKRSENRQRKRERQCRTEQEKEKER